MFWSINQRKLYIRVNPNFTICENKGADQLCSNCEADQRLCFRYTDGTISLLLKSEISSFWLASMTTGWFVSDLVRNPKDQFSRVATHTKVGFQRVYITWTCLCDVPFPSMQKKEVHCVAAQINLPSSAKRSRTDVWWFRSAIPRVTVTTTGSHCNRNEYSLKNEKYFNEKMLRTTCILFLPSCILNSLLNR